MAVKGSSATHRQRQAEGTKKQIAVAARVLFADRGYVATTISAISEAAAIPAPTIYSAFGTKAAILHAIAADIVGSMDVARRHDEALARPDPAEGLRLVAAIQREQYELMYDVIAVYQEAARTDAEIARSLDVIMRNRERGFRRHIDSIADHLAAGLTVDDGVVLYLTFVLPEAYRTLTIENRWSPARYERWLADALIQHLLVVPAP